MKLNDLLKPISTVGRFLATALFCVLAVAFVWQGAFFSNTAAMAAPTATLIAEADISSQVQDNLNKGAKLSKDFIDDTKERVERTANKNADRVDQATDDNGSVVERKANRDEARIYKRAEEDAARTKEQVDRSKNAVESAVDKIKDAFSKQRIDRRCHSKQAEKNAPTHKITPSPVAERGQGAEVVKRTNRMSANPYPTN